MPKIFSCTSFRGGTGKTNIIANLAVLIAMSGKRVGVLDADLASSGIRIPLGLDPESSGFALNDYLWGRCEIEQTIYDLSSQFGGDIRGKLFLSPSIDFQEKD